MKHFILFLSILITCLQAKPQDKDGHITAIEKSIAENVYDARIGYQPGKLDTIVIVRAKDAISDFNKKLPDFTFPGDFDKAIEAFTEVYERARKNNDKSIYHVWRWEVDRMKRLKVANPDDLDYLVCKYTYSTNASLSNNKERVTVEKIYFFNHEDKLAGSLLEYRIKNLKTDNIESDLHPYELALIELETGLR